MAKLGLFPGLQSAAIPVNIGIAGMQGAQGGVVGLPAPCTIAKEDQSGVAISVGEVVQTHLHAALMFIVPAAAEPRKWDAHRTGDGAQMRGSEGIDQNRR